MIGTVEKIEYTQGGAGNQWTTIDGVKYATWWDVMNPKLQGLKRGARVEFEPYERSLWSGQPRISCARVRHVVQP